MLRHTILTNLILNVVHFSAFEARTACAEERNTVNQITQLFKLIVIVNELLKVLESVVAFEL